jgi:hypothetical protein
MAATQLRASKTASWHSKDRQLRVVAAFGALGRVDKIY